jgi:hypothetical protein
VADNKLENIFRSRGINSDGATDTTAKMQANVDALDRFNSDSADVRFIQKQAWWRWENIRQWNIFRKRRAQDNQKAQAWIENFLDTWLFQHGKKVSELTETERRNLIFDAGTRYEQMWRSAVTRKEQAEFRAMKGCLGEGFEDLERPMGDLPSDADFRKAIIKQENAK